MGILGEKPVLWLWLPLQSWGAGAAHPPARQTAPNLGPEALSGGWGFLGQRQGTPGVLPEGHAQPGLWGQAAGGEAVVLGLKLELAVAAGQRLVRLALCLGHRHDGLSGVL